MDEEIRAPDQVVRERLLPSTSYHPPISEEDQLAQIMAQSEQDYELQMAIEASEIEAVHNFAREERTKRFAPLKQKFTRLQALDKNNANHYGRILTYISVYESRGVDRVQVDDAFYTKFRLILDNMRLTQEERRLMLDFIVPLD
jgi:hypothetical protein